VYKAWLRAENIFKFAKIGLMCSKCVPIKFYKNTNERVSILKNIRNVENRINVILFICTL